MKTWLKSLIIFFLLCISWFCPAAWADDSVEPLDFQNLSSAPADVQKAFVQVTQDFSLYEQFLQASYLSDGSYCLIQVQTPAQAHSLLEGGFTPDLSDAICALYSRWDEKQQHLLLIPQEGLPILHSDDKAQITFQQINPAEIIFQRLYQDCFATQESYVFSVKALNQDGVWKIESLNLDASSETKSGSQGNDFS